MGKCFWTDMVGCVEDCTPPPTPMLNIVGNNGYATCNNSPSGGILTPDQYGDLGQITVPINTVWDAAHPLKITAPVRAAPRGNFPGGGSNPGPGTGAVPYYYGGLQLRVLAGSTSLDTYETGDIEATITAADGTPWVTASGTDGGYISVDDEDGVSLDIDLNADLTNIDGSGYDFGSHVISALNDVDPSLQPLDAGTLTLTVGYPPSASGSVLVTSATLYVSMGNCY